MSPFFTERKHGQERAVLKWTLSLAYSNSRIYGTNDSCCMYRRVSFFKREMAPLTALMSVGVWSR
jgi:hypothetical protein